jgi:HEAT repeat protein
MTKVDAYREALRTLDDWDAFLLQESRLPGPRANLELAQAVAEEGDEELFRRLLSFDGEGALTNSPLVFLICCGILGLGKLLAEGNREVLPTLRRYASDPRWRLREAVAMALQRLGEVDMDALLREMERWSKGNLLEQRAAAAALCELKLLREASRVERVLQTLDAITTSLQQVENRRSDEFKALRKGLGYCWSVAVAALPEVGTPMMEQWCASKDKDVLWVMKENLKKKRLTNMDAEWVARWKRHLGM